jgi:hypothetical protein
MEKENVFGSPKYFGYHFAVTDRVDRCITGLVLLEALELGKAALCLVLHHVFCRVVCRRSIAPDLEV